MATDIVNVPIKIGVFHLFAIPAFLFVISLTTYAADIAGLLDLINPYLDNMVNTILFFPLGPWMFTLLLWWLGFETWLLFFLLAKVFFFDWLPKWIS